MDPRNTTTVKIGVYSIINKMVSLLSQTSKGVHINYVHLKAGHSLMLLVSVVGCPYFQVFGMVAMFALIH